MNDDEQEVWREGEALLEIDARVKRRGMVLIVPASDRSWMGEVAMLGLPRYEVLLVSAEIDPEILKRRISEPLDDLLAAVEQLSKEDVPTVIWDSLTAPLEQIPVVHRQPISSDLLARIEELRELRPEQMHPVHRTQLSPIPDKPLASLMKVLADTTLPVLTTPKRQQGDAQREFLRQKSERGRRGRRRKKR